MWVSRISAVVERVVGLFPRFACVRVKCPFSGKILLGEVLWGPSRGRLFF